MEKNKGNFGEEVLRFFMQFGQEASIGFRRFETVSALPAWLVYL
jgi:hypothetical protein